MAPTRSIEEIEGRYKEYAYSPVSASSSSAVYGSIALGKQPVKIVDGDEECSGSNSVEQKCHRVAEMTEKGSTVLQYVAAAAANLCTVAGGAMLGWTSPVLARLQTTLDDNPLGVLMTKEESSWVGSLVALGTMVGSFLAAYLAERWGRKRTLLASVVPYFVGWILIGTAGHVAQLYAARLVFGVALSFTFTVVPMYVGEIAEISVRGALGSFLQLFITIGLLFSYGLGPYTSYLVFCILCASLLVVFFLCFMTMPESPYFLLKVGRKEDAISSLARLRGKSAASVQKEADEMQVAVEEAFRSEATISDLFKVKANFKALIYTCALASFQQLSGVNFVLFYMENIFISAGTTLATAVATIIVGVVQMLASGVTPVVVDRLGRRLLLVFSGVGETVTLAALGLYFYLKDVQKSDVSDIALLPIFALVIFISTYSVGWGPLPWSVMGEMFASDVKSKASGITVSVCWFLAFLITKFASNLQQSFGDYTLYWIFGVCCVLSILFTLFILPETKGKSLQEIQDELNGVKRSIPEFDGAESAAKK